MSILHAENLADLIKILKQESGDSDETLGTKIGVGGTTIYRIRQGAKVDDATLDKVAAYAKVSRDWIYSLAKGVKADRQYSQTVTMIAEMLDQAPEEIQNLFFTQIRAVLEQRDKRNAKAD